MQLLRDNLTLWTSSDGGEAEVAPGSEVPKEEDKATAPTAARPEPTPATSEAPAAEPAAAS